MKLILLKYKIVDKLALTYLVEEDTLFKDIPTLGIAFTCIDNWCSDNGRDLVTMKDLDFDYSHTECVISTTKNDMAKDDYDVIFKLIND